MFSPEFMSYIIKYQGKEYLPDETWFKLNKMIHDIPYQNNLVHGDMHLKNVLIRPMKNFMKSKLIVY